MKKRDKLLKESDVEYSSETLIFDYRDMKFYRGQDVPDNKKDYAIELIDCFPDREIAPVDNAVVDDASRVDAEQEETSLTRETKTILFWKAAECRGIKYLWTMLAAVYVSSIYAAFRIKPPFIGWIRFSDEHARLHAMEPEPPIP